MSRDIIGHRSNIVRSLDIYNPNVQNRIKGMAAAFQAKGKAPNVATQMAHQAMDGSVSVQATILTYMDIFLYIGCMFLVCVPLVLFFIKKSKAKVSMADAAH
jgi:MFS transporter, DHA2 family, multidrug resistance protein